LWWTMIRMPIILCPLLASLLARAPGSTRRRARKRELCADPNERVGEHRADVEPGLLRDFDKARRARHVDFGEIVADHVETDDDQALGPKLRPERRGNLAVARSQRPGNCAAARGGIAPRLDG